MKSGICRAGLGVVLVILAVLAVLSSACGSSLESEGNQSPIISGLEANYMYVYPLGASEIRCIASDPDGDQVSFKWSTTGGSFDGVGPVVVWKSPNSYGDYHIMVIVKDGKGGSAQATLTLSVVTRPSWKGCCGR